MNRVKATEEEQLQDQQGYQALVVSLMYLATCTRQDIGFVLARFCSKPLTGQQQNECYDI